MKNEGTKLTPCLLPEYMTFNFIRANIYRNFSGDKWIKLKFQEN